MARIRTVKPELFRHEELFEAEKETGLPLRLSFIALFTVCDREGRFKWKPRALKLDCLPYDDIDFSKVLDSLNNYSFIEKYEVDGEIFGCIPSFLDHQVINIREAKSVLPSISMCTHVHAHENQVHDLQTYQIVNGEKIQCTGINIPQKIREYVLNRDDYQCVRCLSRENLEIDHIFPQSIGGTHSLNNLRVLCKSCNCARPVAGEALLNDLQKDGLTMDDMKRMCTHVHAHGEGKRKGREKEGKGKGREHGSLAPSAKKSSCDVDNLLSEFGITGTLAEDFKTHRKHCSKNSKGAPITRTSLDGYQREAKKAGISLSDAIRISIEKGWQGFNASWEWQSVYKNPDAEPDGYIPSFASPFKKNDSIEAECKRIYE